MLFDVHLLHIVIIAVISIVAYYVSNRYFYTEVDKKTFLQIVLLINPWPLFMISPGAAGFVYSADLLAFYYLTRRDFYTIKKKALPLVVLLLVLYFVQPIFNSLPSFFKASSNDIKYLLLQIGRGILYISVYLSFFKFNQKQHVKNILLCIAVWWFFYLFVCLLHYSNLITLNDSFLPNFDIDEYNLGKIGRGTFGLYRGALGALSCIILFIGLPILLEKNKSVFIALLILLTLSIEVFCASRMSLLFTVIYVVVYLAVNKEYLKQMAFLIIMLIMLIPILTTSDLFFPYVEYFKQRFVNEFLDETNSYNNILIQRDPKIAAILNNEVSLFNLNFGDALDFRYVDSELFLIFQKNGIFGLLLYFAFIIINLFYISTKRLVVYLGGKWYTFSLISSCIFIPFHFYIYSTFTHQAVSSYVLFALYGVWLRKI